MLLFAPLCFRHSFRRISTFSPLRQQKLASKDVFKDGSRILRVVQRRIDERANIQSQLSDDMASPEDVHRLRQLKESELLQEAWDHWTSTLKALENIKPLLSDPDPAMMSLAAEEAEELDQKLSTILKHTFPSLLVPPSTTANLSALVELKSGVGGTESSLFLETLLRMYMRFSQSHSWKASIVANNDNEGGGIKDAIVEIKGLGAYDTLRWESGVHRVQRVPATESGGRVHTSTVAVIVLPLIEEQDAQKEALYSMDDIRLEVMRARGAGGQHVNKTESAVRITHIPTGITVSMQDERSQHQNKRRAFQVLSARLMDRKITREIAERRATKNSLIKSADRSEKIRTYNYAQERVTDHRIGLSIMNLSSVIEGNALQDFTDALKQDFEETTMEDMLEGEA
ncbi:peptide chain release factor 1 [Lentinula detonsa]|uniref:Peptide chain release factor 1 n=1 Tax=Lentinula detonsa TaxID=2804962 RepID=A0AA38Q6Y3_9AGAR|nr:peptide chain release factor 1 [Lentinula detonsa]